MIYQPKNMDLTIYMYIYIYIYIVSEREREHKLKLGWQCDNAVKQGNQYIKQSWLEFSSYH